MVSDERYFVQLQTLHGISSLRGVSSALALPAATEPCLCQPRAPSASRFGHPAGSERQ